MTLKSAHLPGDPPPYFTSHVFVCTNERAADHPRGSCKARGSEELRDYMKARAKQLGLVGVRVNAAGCLDRCEHGPTVVIYPEGVWYRVSSKEEADQVLQAHVRDGGRVPELMLPAEQAAPKG